MKHFVVGNYTFIFYTLLQNSLEFKYVFKVLSYFIQILIVLKETS